MTNACDMRQKKNNIRHQLRQWGKDQSHAPARTDEIKTSVLRAFELKGETKVKRPNRFVWLTLAVSTLVVLLFASNPEPYSSPSGIKTPKTDISQDPYAVQFVEDSLGGRLGGSSEPSWSVNTIIDRFKKPSVQDTREFLKTGYSAYIQTRHVERIATHVQTMVRGHGGRLDSVTVSESGASISFVIPKSSFDRFTVELHALALERFLEEYVSTKNVLPQKQQIESQAQSAEERLADLVQKREALVTSHEATIASLKGRINNYAYRISVLKKEQEISTSTARQQEIDRDLASLHTQLRAQQGQLNRENNQFGKTLTTYDHDIRSIEQDLDSLAVEDQDLLDDVETVEGYISIKWINILELLHLYVPIYWLIVGLLFLLVASIPFVRRRSFDRRLIEK